MGRYDNLNTSSLRVGSLSSSGGIGTGESLIEKWAREDEEKKAMIKQESGGNSSLQTFGNKLAAGLARENVDNAESLSIISGNIGAFKESYHQADLNIDKGRLGYLLSEGMGGIEEVQQIDEINAQIQASQQRIGDNHYISAATGQIAPFVKESIEKGGKGYLVGAMIGGTLAAAAGQMGPQAGLPEEVVTVPAAAHMGGKVVGMFNSIENMRQIEQGSAFLDMTDSGVDPEIAKWMSRVYGGASAGLEMAQLKILSKMLPGGSQIARNAFGKAVKHVVDQRAVRAGNQIIKTAGGESLVEGSQELTGNVLEEFAKIINDELKGTDLGPKDTYDFIQKALKGVPDVIAKTFAGMGVVAIPGASINFVIDSRGKIQMEESGTVAEPEVAEETVPEPELTPKEKLAAAIAAGKKRGKDAVKKSKPKETPKPEPKTEEKPTEPEAPTEPPKNEEGQTEEEAAAEDAALEEKAKGRKYGPTPNVDEKLQAEEDAAKLKALEEVKKENEAKKYPKTLEELAALSQEDAAKVPEDVRVKLALEAEGQSTEDVDKLIEGLNKTRDEIAKEKEEAPEVETSIPKAEKFKKDDLSRVGVKLEDGTIVEGDTIPTPSPSQAKDSEIEEIETAFGKISDEHPGAERVYITPKGEYVPLSDVAKKNVKKAVAKDEKKFPDVSDRIKDAATARQKQIDDFYKAEAKKEKPFSPEIQKAVEDKVKKGDFQGSATVFAMSIGHAGETDIIDAAANEAAIAYGKHLQKGKDPKTFSTKGPMQNWWFTQETGGVGSRKALLEGKIRKSAASPADIVDQKQRDEIAGKAPGTKRGKTSDPVVPASDKSVGPVELRGGVEAVSTSQEAKDEQAYIDRMHKLREKMWKNPEYKPTEGEALEIEQFLEGSKASTAELKRRRIEDAEKEAVRADKEAAKRLTESKKGRPVSAQNKVLAWNPKKSKYEMQESSVVQGVRTQSQQEKDIELVKRAREGKGGIESKKHLDRKGLYEVLRQSAGDPMSTMQPIEGDRDVSFWEDLDGSLSNAISDPKYTIEAAPKGKKVEARQRVRLLSEGMRNAKRMETIRQLMVDNKVIPMAKRRLLKESEKLTKKMIDSDQKVRQIEAEIEAAQTVRAAKEKVQAEKRAEAKRAEKAKPPVSLQEMESQLKNLDIPTLTEMMKITREKKTLSIIAKVRREKMAVEKGGETVRRRRKGEATKTITTPEKTTAQVALEKSKATKEKGPKVRKFGPGAATATPVVTPDTTVEDRIKEVGLAEVTPDYPDGGTKDYAVVQVGEKSPGYQVMRRGTEDQVGDPDVWFAGPTNSKSGTLYVKKAAAMARAKGLQKKTKPQAVQGEVAKKEDSPAMKAAELNYLEQMRHPVNVNENGVAVSPIDRARKGMQTKALNRLRRVWEQDNPQGTDAEFLSYANNVSKELAEDASERFLDKQEAVADVVENKDIDALTEQPSGIDAVIAMEGEQTLKQLRAYVSKNDLNVSAKSKVDLLEKIRNKENARKEIQEEQVAIDKKRRGPKAVKKEPTPEELVQEQMESDEFTSEKVPRRFGPAAILNSEKGSVTTEPIQAAVKMATKIKNAVADKLDVEARWQRMKADATGLAVKTFHSVSQRHEDRAAHVATGIAKAVKKAYPKVKGVELKELMADVVLGAEKLDTFRGWSAEKQARLSTPVAMLRDYFDETLMEYEEAGITGINFYQNKINSLRKQMGKLKDINQMTDMNRRLGEMEKLEFIHLPVSRWFPDSSTDTRTKKAMERAKRKRGYDILVAKRKRHATSIHDLLEKNVARAGKDPKFVLEKKDIDPVSILLNYGAQVGRDMAMVNIREAAKKDGFVSDAKSKPQSLRALNKKLVNATQKLADATPKQQKRLVKTIDGLEKKLAAAEKLIDQDDIASWEKMDGQEYSAFKGLWVDTRLRDALNTTMATDDRHSWWEKQVSTIKMAQFYNPIFMPMYDLWQSGFMGGLATDPLGWGKSVARAIKDVESFGDRYQRASQWGTFSKPYSNPLATRDKQERMIREVTKYDGIGGSLLDFAKMVGKEQFTGRAFGKDNRSIIGLPVGGFYTAMWNAAWKMDAVIRQGTFNYLVDEKGFSDKEAAQTAAKIHADYAGVPATTRKALNKVIFTPTFAISMVKVQTAMVTEALRFATRRGQTDSQKRLALGAMTTTATILGMHMYMLSQGYEPEKFGRSYVKTIDTEDGPREIRVNLTTPLTKGLKYLYWLLDYGYKPLTGGAPERSRALQDFMRAVSYEGTPLLRTIVGVSSNQKPNGDKIFYDNDSGELKVIKTAGYVIKDTLAFLDLLDQKFPRERKEVSEELSRSIGSLLNNFEKVNGVYVSSRKDADSRFSGQINQLKRDFQTDVTQALKRGEDYNLERLAEEYERRIRKMTEQYQENN